MYSSQQPVSGSNAQRQPIEFANVTPTYNSASVLPGFEFLAQVECVFLKLKAVPFSFLVPKYRLTVLSSSEQPLYVFDEKVPGGPGCCGGVAFSIVMKDAVYGPDVLWLEESVGGCCGDGAGVGVKYGNGNLPIGSVQKTGMCGPPSFDICDAAGRPALTLGSQTMCCGGMEYGLRRAGDGSGEAKLGTVAHQDGGCCPTSTTLEVTFPLQLDVNLKAMVLAGAVLLLYYTRRQRQQ